MNTQESDVENKKKLLYNYWQKLPFMKTFENSNFSQMEESEVKSFIIKYIRDGVEDEFGEKNQLARRHAFTAKELYTAYSKKEDSVHYSMSNFHFHIKTLVADGYLIEITKILEGRHYIAYYGRTAKIFSGQYDNILADSRVTDIFEPLKQLVKDMNPEIDSNRIDQLIDENILLMHDYYYRFFSWVMDKYPHLYKSKVDIRKLLDVISHYAFFHTKFAENLNKIGILLDFDKIMEYEKYKG